MSAFVRTRVHLLLAGSTTIEAHDASKSQREIPEIGVVSFIGSLWVQNRSNGDIKFSIRGPKDSNPKELINNLLPKIDELVKTALSVIPDDVVCPEEFDPDALTLNDAIFFGTHGLKLFFTSDYSKRHLDYLMVVFNSFDSLDVFDRFWIS